MLASEELHLVAGRDPRYFCKKGNGMLAREQILEIDHYCAEHKMSLEARIDEIGVPHHRKHPTKYI